MEDVPPVLADEAIDESLQHDHHDPDQVASTMTNELPVLTALAASNATTEQQRYAPLIVARSNLVIRLSVTQYAGLGSSC